MENNEDAKVVILRCYGRPGKHNGDPGYYAVCIDLNLVTWRKTSKEAHDSLMESIEGYVETAIEVAENPQELESLLSRKSPAIPYRATYHLIALLAALPGNGRSDNKPVLYHNPVKVPV